MKVGTTVRDRKYEASIAKMTDIASGPKRYFAVPCRKKMGTKTTQMHSVETKAGTAICWAPSRMAFTSGLSWLRLRVMFSTSTVASSTRMPTARARPPSVIVLIVSPRAERQMIEVKIERGIDMATTSVFRHEPRKRRIIAAVRQAAMTASRITPWRAARTKTDWSKRGSTCRALVRPARMRGSAFFTLLMMSRVEALPFFRTVRRAPRVPSVRTMEVCGAKPSRTCATSWTRMVAPFTTLTGSCPNSDTRSGLLFIRNWYSRVPIFAVPLGRVRFWESRALLTSAGVRPCAWSACRSKSTLISLDFPPEGSGMEAPCTVASGIRTKLRPRSKRVSSGSVLLERASCRMGTEEALKRITRGGVVPGGIERSAVWQEAVT